jgi:hypothetical protein
VNEICIFLPPNCLLWRSEIASKLSLIELNFTSAMFFSFDCIKIFTFSTVPYAEKIFLNEASLQFSFFTEETCRVYEGGLTVIDRFGVNLYIKKNTDHRTPQSKWTRCILEAFVRSLRD